MVILDGHWNTTNFVASLTTRGLVVPFVSDGTMNRAAYEAYVAQVLVPDLKSCNVVVMDGPSSPKGPRRAG